ncbi:MAG: hypothetical protein ACFFCD_12605 [Promethearchaeota archaeon]
MKASEQVRAIIREAISLIEADQKDEAKLQLKMASDLTKEIPSDYLRPYILNEIAEALFKLGESNEGLQLIQEAVNTSDQLDFTSSRLEILLKIAKSLSAINFEPKDVRVHQEALNIAKWIIAKPIPAEQTEIPHEVAALIRNIARSTEDLHMLHEIIMLSKQLDERYYFTMLMRNISERLVELCNDTTDTTFINELIELVDLIEPSDRKKTIAAITRLLTQTAEHTENPDIIQIALKLSDKMPSDYYRSKIQSKLFILKEKVKSP